MINIQEVINTYYQIQLDVNNRFFIKFFYLNKPSLSFTNITVTLEKLNYFLKQDNLILINIIVNYEEFTYQYCQNAWYRIL